MKKKQVNSSRTPVYRDAGFELYDADTASAAFAKEANPERDPEIYIYSRYRNPTVVAAEEEIMKLEGASQMGTPYTIRNVGDRYRYINISEGQKDQSLAFFQRDIWWHDIFCRNSAKRIQRSGCSKLLSGK
jgi:hypothetical protein